jgi:hypothetical protein
LPTQEMTHSYTCFRGRKWLTITLTNRLSHFELLNIRVNSVFCV